MNNYHYSEARQLWLVKNKKRLNEYMRNYIFNKRHSIKGNIIIKKQNITISFD